VLVLAGFNSSALWAWGRSVVYDKPAVWSSGGPVQEINPDRSAVRGGVVYFNNASTDNADNSVFWSKSAVAGASDPLTNLISSGDGLRRYKIRKGDTFANLAAHFNISADTLKWANSNVKTLKLNNTLIIPPVSGVIYNVSKNDNLENIAGLYNIDAGLIKTYNPDYQKILSDGSGYLMLPFAKPVSSKPQTPTSDLPDIKDYFALPAIGWNWGQLHNYNAVDIANQCGTPVHASAEGLVVADENLGSGASGWNDGYGVFVLVEHPNGTKTRYAHLDKASVKIGDYVSRGEEIGLMGNTGSTHGPTGCHLHFEVYGAKNPFAVSK